jgi:uncharacterized protein
MTDPRVPSPCVRLCTLDRDDVCVGCGRHIQEIIEWGEASDDRRRAILAESQQRLAILQARREAPHD